MPSGRVVRGGSSPAASAPDDYVACMYRRGWWMEGVKHAGDCKTDPETQTSHLSMLQFFPKKGCPVQEPNPCKPPPSENRAAAEVHTWRRLLAARRDAPNEASRAEEPTVTRISATCTMTRTSLRHAECNLTTPTTADYSPRLKKPGVRQVVLLRRVVPPEHRLYYHYYCYRILHHYY